MPSIAHCIAFSMLLPYAKIVEVYPLTALYPPSQRKRERSKEGLMPGELDSTEVQLTVYFRITSQRESIAQVLATASPAAALGSSCAAEYCEQLSNFEYNVRRTVRG